MSGFKFNDGGRAAAGFKGHAGDCVTRAVAIASGRPYAEVYTRLAEINAAYRGRSRRGRSQRGVKTAAHGIFTKAKAFKDYMGELGFVWTPTMAIGQGCKVHLTADELPKGRLVVMVSRHAVAMLDGVLHDTYDPRRPMFESRPDSPRRAIETRCVYGYWRISDLK